MTGDTDGNIAFWNHNSCRITKIVKNANSSCFSLLVLGEMVLSGGKDGSIVEWDSDLRKTGRSLQLPEDEGGCRVIIPLVNGSLLIGTTHNRIYEANISTGTTTCIVAGHFEELWGLAPHQLSNKRSFLTCGNDKILSLWDANTHSNIWSIQLEEKLQSVCSHPSLEVVAIGTVKNKWLVYDLTSRQLVHTCQIDKENDLAITRIQYSPNGQYLACACRDNSVYIYEVSEDGMTCTKLGKCSGHSSCVAQVDWSLDSKYLVSNSGDYETLYWDAKSCKQLTNVQIIREIQWTTNTTCTLTFNTLGLWHSKYDSNYIYVEFNIIYDLITHDLMRICFRT